MRLCNTIIKSETGVGLFTVSAEPRDSPGRAFGKSAQINGSATDLALSQSVSTLPAASPSVAFNKSSVGMKVT